MRVTYPALSLSGNHAAHMLQLMPKRSAEMKAAPHTVSHRSPSAVNIPAGADLKYSVQSNGKGMTVKLIDRLSGEVLTTLEYRTPSLHDVEMRARAGSLVDVSA